MDKIRTVIIEDDRFIVEILRDLLKEKHREIEILAIANNGEEGILKIEQLKPDLIFLDIEMPDMNGFEMLSRMNTRPFKTIFTTAHSQYAIQAFRFNALDYLLKPIDADELYQAIKRFKVNRGNNQELHIKNALQNMQAKSNREQRLILETQNGILCLDLSEIMYLESDRNYSIIHTENGVKELSSKTLGYFDERLTEKGFFRSHRSYLINSNFVNQIQTDAFVLKDKRLIPISRRKKNEAKEWFLNQSE